ncbi:MAG: hypothetical protein GVY24_08400 [Planctomycetes bacterium]|jgi:uroporphyrinogen decarboxylase|nr:hypothetical protein [Planctomycetota bacterium]
MPATTDRPADGVHALPPRDAWSDSARKRRDTYALTPDAPLLHIEFGFMEGTKQRWRQEGMTDESVFGFEPAGDLSLGGLGWCEAAFLPAFEETVLEDRGDYELVRDFAGRAVLCFKDRRQGFMPEYVDHPVKDMRTWEQDVKWRLAPDANGRFDGFEDHMARAREAAGRGEMIVANMIGGYMYLRSLIGPEELLYTFIDQPDLIHDCMKAWFELADAVTAKHQQHVTIDELFLAEDIAYNNGALISPDMMRRFLFPYYQQLIENIRARQLDPDRHLFVQIDTDGNVNDVIDVYREIGMNAMSPFEVASGCDVVEIGRRYPGLVMKGGIDKRVLAQGKPAIDEMVERIIPAMRKRGGYIPCCDHMVPNEVPFDDYRHYRRRCLELGG